MSKHELAAIPGPRTSPESALPRPFWQTQPCPPWCAASSSAAGHTGQDAYDEREHYCFDVDIPLTLCEAEGRADDATPPDMSLGAFQHYRAAAADIVLAVPVEVPVANGSRRYVIRDVRMTVAEARALRDGLTALLDAVDGTGNAEVSS